MESHKRLESELFNRVQAAGQSGLLRFWSILDRKSQERLWSDLEEVDFEEINRLFIELVEVGPAVREDLSALEPALYISLPEAGGDPAAWAEAAKAGEHMVRSGKVAAFTVAGGQGTRLGFDGPKGTFPITPVAEKSLFEVLAGKIRASSFQFRRPVPWYIMTSRENHEETVHYFDNNGYFGLDRKTVRFFSQGRMPAVDFNGRILLSSPDSAAMSPDGHGGSLRALSRSGALEEMAREGIEIISYFQVDNPLVRPVDPAFIGFHRLRRSEMSSKTVLKTCPEEKVGVFCRQGERVRVIEYSDLPEELARASDVYGRLRFPAGSIAIHLLERTFVERMASEDAPALRLPFHRADKKIPTIDWEGRPLNPATVNGVKFEMFVFDAIPFARNPIIVETDRREEFSPVKNKSGIDSAESCRVDQLRRWARWLRAAGEAIECDATGLPKMIIEVSPLFAADEDTFVRKWLDLPGKPEIRDGMVVE